MRLFQAPLYEALKNHLKQSPRSFHVPGHQYGRAYTHFPHEIQADYRSLLALDVTELNGLDDLHEPTAAIEQAQQLAAAAYGAEESLFLVGGSTVGNLALILAHCAAGDIIIVQRNVHKSILNGIQLSGARAVFLSPMIDSDTGLSGVPQLSIVEQALIQYPTTRAVFLTSPNYYGMSINLQDYVDCIHRYKCPVFIDEAHGAHYGLHSDLPRSALAAGADGVVQSTHKTLPAMTMGAMLHLQGQYVHRAAVRRILSMLQSSSPSYPIMASLDLTRALVQYESSALFEPALQLAAEFKQQAIEQWQALAIIKPQSVYKTTDGTSHPIVLDPLRLVLYDRTQRLTGYELLQLLEQQGCYAEMADPRHVVLLIGLSFNAIDMQALLTACKYVDDKLKQVQGGVLLEIEQGEQLPSISEPTALIHAVPSPGKLEQVQLVRAAGRISAEMIVPYPPGIPLLFPGERIVATHISMMQKLIQANAKIQGNTDASMKTILVYRE